MKRKIGLAMLAIAGLLAPTIASADDGASVQEKFTIEEGSRSSGQAASKLDVLGVWSHPDDDAGIIAPCGVWGQEADIDCGIMLTTRGEGGSNSVGPEAGPDLGLRRENEDRASHVRSGTVDFYYLDRVDFFYNTSSPLTEEAWGEDEVLRRATRVVRETQPEILVSWSAAPAGHGNHQYASRLAFDAAAAASDPTMFPEQLTGTDAVDTWQVKKIAQQQWGSRDDVVDAKNCFADAEIAANGYTTHGTWTGYESPYAWVEGNTAGIAAGTLKTWAQVGSEDGQLHATQGRTMVKDLVNPGCTVYKVPKSWVPMQGPGTDGAGDDLALHYGSSIEDPGGLPLGTIYATDVEEYFVAPGETGTITLNMKAGDESTPAGTASVAVPDGWTVDGAKSVPAMAWGAETNLEFTVTAPADAENGPVRFPVNFESADGDVTAYNEAHLEVTAPVDGRFARWGNFLDYEEWLQESGGWADGLSPAIDRIGAGETITVDIEVSNRTSEPASGAVEFDGDDNFSFSANSVEFTDIPAGETTTVSVRMTHTDPDALGGTNEFVTVTTTSGASVSTENIDFYVVPTVLIPELDDAPQIDAEGDEYTKAIDISQRWEGTDCTSETDCGADSSAKLGWHEDHLYMWIDVVDDVASGAVTLDRCFGHWLVDSVEVQLDPSGASVDTSTTFKLGIFPFTDDPDNVGGNGVDGPCWTRDADNNQGFSSGPLGDALEGGPNAEGVEVAVNVERDGNTYVDGRYQIEVKIPLDVLPAATGGHSKAPTGVEADNDVDPSFMGMNISPYDTDRQDFVGDTRLAWSPFGSQQSEPYRWGHAYLDGYEPPADRSHESDAPTIPNTALQGAESPQMVHQSATHGDTIGGLQPNGDVNVTPTLTGDTIDLAFEGAGDGTVRAFVWQGDPRYVPVWTSSCEESDFGADACSVEDGKSRPWAPDMNGRLLASDQATGAASLSLDLSAAELDADEEIYLLVSYAGAADVEAWSFPIVAQEEEPVVGPTGNVFFISNSWDNHIADITVVYGREGDEVLVGDWDGDGKDTLGVRRGKTFFLDNALKSGNADIEFKFGREGDEVLVGDFNGDGKDTVTVRRGKTYYVNNSFTGGNADVEFKYGREDDESFAGDFDGDGKDSLTVRRGKTYYVANELRGGNADVEFKYGREGDEVFIGDFDGDGKDTITIRRGIVFYVNNSLVGGEADHEIKYGRADDRAYVGDWDGDGIDTPVVNRYVR